MENSMNNQVFEKIKSIAKVYNIQFSNENDIEKCKQEFFDKANWHYISAHQKLPEEFIREFSDKVNWDCSSQLQKLSEGFIREFSDKVNWVCISTYQKLSERFIKEFSDKVNWVCISTHQKLSEGFIREFSDKVDWDYISKHQHLSEGFIREFSDKVNWDYISKHQHLSEGFIREFKLTIPKDCWLYKTKEEKLSYLKKYCKDIYEIVNNEYIVAYKSTRIDGYSTFNFQYQYKIGEKYESHCDYNVDDQNSFGLSAWTKDKALEHYNRGNLYKVHINIEDIGAIVHNNKKIRCNRLLIVSQRSF